jgi:hypothetical protein
MMNEFVLILNKMNFVWMKRQSHERKQFKTKQEFILFYFFWMKSNSHYWFLGFETWKWKRMRNIRIEKNKKWISFEIVFIYFHIRNFTFFCLFWIRITIEIKETLVYKRLMENELNGWRKKRIRINKINSIGNLFYYFESFISFEIQFNSVFKRV